MYDQNHLATSIRRASVGRDDAVFVRIHQTGETVSYGAFFANAERVAAALVRVGVRPGDRVAVQAPKTVAMLELYIGTVMAGAVFLPLNPAYSAAEVGYFLGDAAPKVFVCDPVAETEMQPVASACDVPVLLTLGTDEGGTLTALRDAEIPGFTPVRRAEGDLAAILYTSGTTGRAKGAMLSHGALVSNSEVLKDYWRFECDDVLIHALPVFHTHGLFVATNVALMAGASLIFMAKFEAGAVRDAMTGATTLMGVPTFYTRLLQSPRLAEAAANMRLFVSGSAPLLAETHARWREVTGHAILERYGMTETGMNASNPYAGERRAGTVGFPLPGVDLIVTDPETGKKLARGETGMLEVRGPNVFDGYWNMPEKTAEDVRENGFFITGDLGLIDTEGYVHIVGRSKDLIISGGFNVYPKEIELLLDEVDGVAESAVIGVLHPDLGEAVVAVIVPSSEAQLSGDAVLARISPKLARFKQPRRIFLSAELPRNAMGKVQKNLLREEYADAFS